MNSIFERVIRGIGSVTSPAGKGSPLTVLLYHRVLDRPDELNPGEPSATQFDQQMSVLARMFNVLALNEALSRLSNGTLPARALSVTFDDGYRDNLDVAVPILQRHGLHATFFITSGLINGGRMMHDTVIETVRRLNSQAVDFGWLGLGRRRVTDVTSRLALIKELLGHVKYLPFEQRVEACERLAALVGDALPDSLMMTSEHVKAIDRAGMHVGAHTHLHPILSKLPAEQAYSQILMSRDLLGQMIGTVPSMFAYPNGKPSLDYGVEHVEMVKKAGFTAAVSVSFGTVTQDSDLLQIPRFCPWDRDPRRFALRLLTHPVRHRASTKA